MVFLLCLLLALLLPVPEPWGAILIAVGALLEVVEVILLRRWAKHLRKTVPVATGVEAMLGGTGTVVDPCTPNGTVRVNGELWAARCDEGAGPGALVRVEAVDELALVVSPVGSPQHVR